MSNQKLISFDLQSDFAFFKKPDYNDGILLSYNMLHKPALLGILGAIIGLSGYNTKGELPQYYQRLNNLLIGIAPLSGKHEKGTFVKTSVKYTNTVGYANKDGNLLIEESMLVNPGYRCYLLLSMDNEDHHKLYEYLKTGQAEFIPYLGKNEFQAWFGESFFEYDYKSFDAKSKFSISSIFIKEGVLRKKRADQVYSFVLESMSEENKFCYFERLPVGFDSVLNQYELAEFAYTNWLLKENSVIDNLFCFVQDNEEKIIQLF